MTEHDQRLVRAATISRRGDHLAVNRSERILDIDRHVDRAEKRHRGDEPAPTGDWNQDAIEIERVMGAMGAVQTRQAADDMDPELAQHGAGLLRELGPAVQWKESFVADDKVYCVYYAPDEAAVRRHAELGGFPADRVSRVQRMIDPTTAE